MVFGFGRLLRLFRARARSATNYKILIASLLKEFKIPFEEENSVSGITGDFGENFVFDKRIDQTACGFFAKSTDSLHLFYCHIRRFE